MVFSLVIVKTYIEQISPGIEESARIDGAGYFSIYIRIILPICIPVLAAIALFSAVNQWNQWYDNLLLVRERGLQTLQLLLWRYLHEAEALAQQMDMAAGSSMMEAYKPSPFSIRMTITIIVVAPIIMVYPFLQRYFIGGILIGAVKG